MGIRINTVLGYGFAHCRGAKDPRFNPWVFTDGKHPTYGDIWDDIGDLRPLLIKWYKKKLGALPTKPTASHLDKDPHWIERSDLEMDLMMLQEKGGFHPVKGRKRREPICLYDIICTSGYASESAIHPIVFTHPVQHDWRRHDDIIDYYAGPDRNDGGIIDHVKMVTSSDRNKLPRPLYPWDSYVNRRTGARVKGTWSGGSDRSMLIDMWRENGYKTKKKWKEVLDSCGVPTMLALQRDIVPYIPRMIVETCAMLDVFKDPLTVYRLKPMIYRYWC